MMDYLPPSPARSAAPASWLAGRVVWNHEWVSTTMGLGFAAHARLLHPLGDGPDAPRWAEVATDRGLALDSTVQWTDIAAGGPSPADLSGAGEEPEEGNLRPVALAPLCEILARHTTTSDRCWFAVWEGWGWLHPGAHIRSVAYLGDRDAPVEDAPEAWQLDQSAASFELPHRRYLLFGGPLSDATRFGHWVTATWFLPQSPSLFWPEDRAWCVATEIDFDSTIIGGTATLVDEIVSDPRLEALPIDAHAPY